MLLRVRVPSLTCLPLLALLVSACGPDPDPTPAPASSVRVIDGDTLDVNGQRIRLHGIDAPEQGQMCESGGKAWECGRVATWALSRITSLGPVSCEQPDTDPYQRIAAVCCAGSGDLDGWLAKRMGWRT